MHFFQAALRNSSINILDWQVRLTLSYSSFPPSSRVSHRALQVRASLAALRRCIFICCLFSFLACSATLVLFVCPLPSSSAHEGLLTCRKSLQVRQTSLYILVYKPMLHFPAGYKRPQSQRLMACIAPYCPSADYINLMNQFIQKAPAVKAGAFV